MPNKNYTLQQEFGYHKAGKKPPLRKSKTHGNLLLDGHVLVANKPFALLNHLKKQYKGMGRLTVVSVLE